MTGASPPATVASRPSRVHWLVFFGLAVTIVMLDQLAKSWVVAGFTPYTPVDVVGEYGRITITHNNGGLFGLFRGQAGVFAVVSLGVIALLVGFHARSGRSALASVALGLLLGGALGNLLDRVRLGYVVDFVDMGIGTWRFYTYNVADAAISTAILLLILMALLPGLTRRPSGA